VPPKNPAIQIKKRKVLMNASIPTKNIAHNWLNVSIIVLIALALQFFTWFVLYPIAGYSDTTLTIAQSIFLLFGLGSVLALRLNFIRIGVGPANLLRAGVGILFSYGILLMFLVLLNILGLRVALFRQVYSPYALVNNWLLTGFGEELVFAGVLFNLVRLALYQPRRPWMAILITSSAFALWHLPGYLAVGINMGTLGPGLIFDLLINIISWVFLGMIYWLSGNLWLTAFAHASTDYSLLPAVTNSPVYGLILMLFIIAFAFWSGRRWKSEP